MKRFSLFICLTLSLGLAQAERLYVTDQLEITLRSGASTEHAILKLLKTGMQVEVLETDEESKYTRVRTEDGEEGWVVSRFLMEQPSARDQLARVRAQVDRLKQENRKLLDDLKTERAEKEAITKQKRRLEDNNRKLRVDIAEIKRVSSNAVEIEEQRKALNDKVIQMEHDLQAFRLENSSLKDRTARDWFMVGAGVMLFGVLTGLILSRMRWRRRSEWDSL